jgi:hypothetical protein
VEKNATVQMASVRIVPLIKHTSSTLVAPLGQKL